MSIFQDVLTDAKGVEAKLMGPDYPYYKYIKTPAQIGMSDKGNLTTLGKDINGLISYVEVLVTGKSKASATGQPLGNKFFLKTGGKCKDKKTGQSVDRYMYIDNVPAGNIPFISSGMGGNFSEFKGLIPGTISNLNAFNPFKIMQAFMSGSSPDCQELTMQTIDTYNNKSTESHFVTLADIQNMDACQFPNKTNPVTKEKCKETFESMNEPMNEPMNGLIYDLANKLTRNADAPVYTESTDLMSQMYLGSIGVLGIYILYRIMLKSHNL